MHRWIAAFAIVAAACGSGGEVAPPEDAAPISLPQTTTSEAPAAPEASGPSVPPVTQDEEDSAAPSVTPALGISTSAADTFDQGHLAADAGSRFVPMDEPVMVAASDVTWLDGDDIVMGIVRGGEAQAFPVGQMAWHHIANTTIAGEPYLVTY